VPGVKLLRIACVALTVWAVCAVAQVAPVLPALRDELVAPLRSAQELLAGKKYAEALSELAATDKVTGKTAVETYYIERMRAAAASGAGDTQQSTRSLEAVIASGQTPKAEQPALIEALAAGHYNLKQYAQAAQWASRYFESGGTNADMLLMMAQSLYLAGDFRSAVRELLVLQRAQQAAGVNTPEPQLDMLAGSYIKLQDDAGYMQVLEQLLRSYPRADYWADLLVRLERRPGFSGALVIDLFRLQFAANALGEASEYLELAQLAVQAGYPAEAMKALDAGFAAGVLGKGEGGDRHARYRLQVGERALAEFKALDAPERQPSLTSNADAMFKLGYLWFTQGRSDAGLALMQQALDAGQMERPAQARLRLGAAYFQAGNKPRARELLQAAQSEGGTDGTADLARLWGILAVR
jgi:Tfp pilus assembly protein PilF